MKTIATSPEKVKKDKEPQRNVVLEKQNEATICCFSSCQKRKDILRAASHTWKNKFDYFQTPRSNFNHTLLFSHPSKRNSFANNSIVPSFSWPQGGCRSLRDRGSCTSEDPSPKLMIMDMLGTLVPKAEAVESPMAEEGEGSSSNLENEANEGKILISKNKLTGHTRS